jgi:hypothetical protein
MVMTVAPVPVPAAALTAPDTAPHAALGSGEDALGGLLDQITALKAEHKKLEQQLEALLLSLNAAMASGQLDPAFSHNDWAFSHSPGRLSYAYPSEVEQLERQLKAAKEAAIQQGNATEKRGKPFWTIRPPTAQAMPF